MYYNISQIRKILKNYLDTVRYEHSLSVSFMCIALAMRYEVDIEKAEIAGLLHDCAKHYDTETIKNKCIKHNISIDEYELENLELLHAKLGAFMTVHEFNIQDMEIINAILHHTTGKAKMSRLEQIVYVADYIEPRRYKAKRLPELRKLAFEDLDLVTAYIMNDTLKYLEDKNIRLDIKTRQAYEYYMSIVRQEK
jgi:putative HD superfamily hydrolase of NAD metabolism